MRTLEQPHLHDPRLEAEALIKEARQRHRRRLIASGMLVVALTGGLLFSLVTILGSSAHRLAPPTTSGDSRAGVLRGIDASVFMWPVGYPFFGPNGGPPAYLDDLSDGRLSLRHLDIAAGDYQPILISVGRSLVYVGYNGTTVSRADLKGAPRVIGRTPFFAPSADAGHIWLKSGPVGKVTVRSLALTGGPPGRAIILPKGSGLVEGTQAGLLLVGGDGNLYLWKPGASLKALPYSPSFSDGFAASPLLVVYGTGCRNEITAPTARYEPNAGYDACKFLRILNVVTDRLSSFPSPPGTDGWIPNSLGTVDAIAPGNRMVAAEAGIPPASAGDVRLFLVRLTGSQRHVQPVPSATAFLFARTAWSPDGSWLFYQGPHKRLSAYRPATGVMKSSKTPCCAYTVMVTVPGSS